MSRVAAGEVALRSEPVSLAGLLLELEPEVRVLTAQKGLEFSADVGEVAVVADPLRLRQVLLNLVSNSVKFTATGLIRLTATADAGLARIVVTDSGIGIPPDQLDRVFEEFTQVGSGKTREHEGPGLGLPMSRRLVELMGGTIELAPAEGGGTEATVRLPLSAPIVRAPAPPDPGA